MESKTTSFGILQISDHLTCPLLAMVGELQRRQQELVKLLKLKDKEIDDYKIQGGKVTRSKYRCLQLTCVSNFNLA